MSRVENFIERTVHNIEQRIQQFREEEAARQTQLREHRNMLWAEAAEREKLLAEYIGDEESRELSVAQAARESGAVFVVHSEDATRALEGLVKDGARLTSVVPGQGTGDTETGVRGSWLLFSS
jgi:hypothetical protein